jgi:predicted nuclease of predicted toxin-antitoxin system
LARGRASGLRFLIDECLHKALVKVAHAAGYEAYHVVDLGKAGAKDYQLRELFMEQEFVFVTNNARHFVRIVEKSEVHPGLLIIVPNVRPAVQDRLFEAALAEISKLPDKINKVVEAWDVHDVRIYPLPKVSVE